jgi:hypothetical protein
VSHLAFAVRAVHGEDDQPEPERGDVRDDQVDGTRGAHHDAIARRQPRAMEPSGHAP